AEVVLILAQVDIVAVVTIAAVLITDGVVRAELPTIFAVGLTGAEAFFVAVVHRLSQHLRAIAIGFVITATTIVAVVVWTIVVVAPTLQPQLVLSQTLKVTLLIT